MRPTLVIMAAGLGSRFGGLKQLAKVDDHGHAIMDYSVYDALSAGFGRIVCIVKPELEQDFRAALGDRIAASGAELVYAHQTLANIPAPFTVPEGREKPFGTGHAVLCAAPYIETPFAVINADDFYGRGAFDLLCDFLSAERGEGEYCMVGYRLKNCLTENGSVSRGICTVTEDGFLQTVTEHTKIFGPKESPRFTEDGETFTPISGDSVTSLNTWGFQQDLLTALAEGFPRFWEEKISKDPMKGEYFLPTVVNEQLAAGKASAKVLPTDSPWYGVTYQEDLASIREAIRRMKAEGLYPEDLWA